MTYSYQTPTSNPIRDFASQERDIASRPKPTEIQTYNKDRKNVRVAQEVPRRKTPRLGSVVFTESEIKVLQLMSEDLNTSEICNLLKKSSLTLKDYEETIKRKLGVTTIAGMISKALQLGMIQETIF